MELKEIWKEYEASKPDIKKIVGQAKKYKAKNLFDLILLNVLAILTVVWVFFIWHHYQPTYLTTKIGIILGSVAIVSFTSVYNQLLPSVWKLGLQMDCRQYLNELLRIKQKRQFIQSRALGVYFVVFSLALSLYCVEHILKMSILMQTVCTLAIVFWILFNWFYIRPQVNKKQNAKIQGLISEFKRIKGQMDNKSI